MASEFRLTSIDVERIFKNCLVQTGEAGVVVEGVIHSYEFHPDRLAFHRDEIVDMLNELPEQFRQDSGGGWSFVQACYDNKGSQWTGMQINMEQLFCLGMAIQKVICLFPRDMWEGLPGGMPFYMINRNG